MSFTGYYPNSNAFSPPTTTYACAGHWSVIPAFCGRPIALALRGSPPPPPPPPPPPGLVGPTNEAAPVLEEQLEAAPVLEEQLEAAPVLEAKPRRRTKKAAAKPRRRTKAAP